MKANRCLVVLILFITTVKVANAQAPSFLWANAMGNTGYDYGLAVASSPAGSNDVYFTGRFQGTVDFDPGPGTFYLTSAGGDDIFISRMDSSGNLVWAKQMGGTANDAGLSLNVDAAGDIYISGYFWGTADFDPAATTYNVTSNGDFDVFITRLTGSGDFVWTRTMGGTSSEYANKLLFGADGNVYIIGWFSGIMDADPGPGIMSMVSSGNNDIYILKLDSSGSFVWARHIGGPSYDYGYSLAVSASGNVYAFGNFEGTVDFNPGTGTFNVTSSGNRDLFILKLNAAGDFIWAKTTGGTDDEYGWSITLDTSAGEDIYTTGDFAGTADFDPQAGIFNLTASGFRDIFISRSDSAGNLIWVKQLEGADVETSYSIASDPGGSKSVYTTGYFHGTVDFDPGPGTFNLVSNGLSDIFICKLDSSGNFEWAKSAGGTNGDWGAGIAVNNSSIYITGTFGSSQIPFDSWQVTNADTAGTTFDMFITKLSTIATGTATLEPVNGITVYPNPASSHFTITLADNNKNVQVSISDITGKLIYAAASTLQRIEVNTKDFAEGVYLVRIQTADFIETRKIIVAR